MKKQAIRLSESQLHNVIKESVRKVMREGAGMYDWKGNWEEDVKHEIGRLYDLEAKVPPMKKSEVHQMIIKLQSFLDDAQRARDFDEF